MDNCATCKYWSGNRSDREEPRHGWALACRRHAPMASLIISTEPNMIGKGATFPQTRSDDWCGDFEREESK